MKLLDLQTGKYLELGKDWWYGGDALLFNKDIVDFVQNKVRGYEPNDCESDYYIENIENDIMEEDEMFDTFYKKHKSEPPLPLKGICKKVGTVVYGGRYVLMSEIFFVEGVEHKYGDFFRFYINKKGDYMVDYRAINCQVLNCKFDKDDKIIKLGNTNIIKIEYIGNPFEEYSKQLRNEPNKFDELNELFK